MYAMELSVQFAEWLLFRINFLSMAAVHVDGVTRMSRDDVADG